MTKERDDFDEDYMPEEYCDDDGTDAKDVVMSYHAMKIATSVGRITPGAKFDAALVREASFMFEFLCLRHPNSAWVGFRIPNLCHYVAEVSDPQNTIGLGSNNNER